MNVVTLPSSMVTERFGFLVKLLVLQSMQMAQGLPAFMFPSQVPGFAYEMETNVLNAI